MQGIGALIFVLPHLLAETYTISGGIRVRMNRTNDNMCGAPYERDGDGAVDCLKEVRLPVCVCVCVCVCVRVCDRERERA